MEALSNAIAQADREQLEKIMKETMHRWNQLYGDWELVWMTLPKYDLMEREKSLKEMFMILLKVDYKKLEKQLEDENV